MRFEEKYFIQDREARDALDEHFEGKGYVLFVHYYRNQYICTVAHYYNITMVNIHMDRGKWLVVELTSHRMMINWKPDTGRDGGGWENTRGIQ